MLILCLPFFLQGIAMGVDEFYFHKKRELPVWERVGHPLDTLSFCLCVADLIFFRNWISYLVFSTISCLLVTKDEWVHTRYCSGGENWLHAVLFILHPICLISAWMLHLVAFWFFLKVELVLLLTFFAYQLGSGFLWSTNAIRRTQN